MFPSLIFLEKLIVELIIWPIWVTHFVMGCICFRNQTLLWLTG
ncbi:hypothetical protein LINPERHAP1_LOCUS37446 [Linum perenne]